MPLVLAYLAFVIWVDPYLGYEVIRSSGWSYIHDALALLVVGGLWQAGKEAMRD
jgi:hypothetical protein